MKSEVVYGEDRLEMTRFFAYPREAVFDAWTKPEQIEKWWGCRDTTRVESKVDLREGGEYSHLMVVHGNEMTYTGKYTEVVVPERLVSETSFGPGMQSKVTIEFLEEDGGTRLKLTQVGLPPMPNACDIISQGTEDSFTKLGEFLAGNR